MPRNPCIDRTITITEADVILLDLKTQKNETVTIYLPREYANANSLLLAIKKGWTDPDLLPVHILKYISYRRSFHMTEDEYINYIIKKEKELENKC